MTTPKTTPDDLVVEIPSDLITLGHDTDGLPRTDPAELPKKADGTPDIDHKEQPDPKAEALKKAEEEAGKAWREERERLTRERDERAREATEAKEHAATERKAREIAEGKAVETTDIAKRAHWRSINADHQQITTSISAWEAAAANAERDYIAASEAGDHAAAAKAQRAIAKAENYLSQLEAGKAGVEAEIDRVKQVYSAHSDEAHGKEEVKQPEKKPDPVKQTPEEWIAGIRANVGDKVADWLDKNREFVTDTKKNARVIAYAQLFAAEEDKPLNSNEFIKKLNAKFLGEEEEVTMAEEEREEPAVVEAKTKSKATPAAPVARGGGAYFSSRNPDAKQIKLPKDVADFCKSARLDPTQYALGVIEDIKAGRKPKEWLDPDYDRGIR